MKLAAYLRSRNLKHQEFAALIGCEQPTVTRFVRGRRIPSAALMRRIVEVTEGEVTANDFFEAESEDEFSTALEPNGVGAGESGADHDGADTAPCCAASSGKNREITAPIARGEAA